MAMNRIDKIKELDEQIEQIKNRQKALRQQHNKQERKDRNHRLCKRGGQIEKLLPALAIITDEQFEVFVKKTLLSGFAEKILREIAPTMPNTDTDENGSTTGETASGSTLNVSSANPATQLHTSTDKSNNSNQDNDEDDDANESDGETTNR